MWDRVNMTLTMSSKTSRTATPISRDTMQDRVYRRLCDMILDGEIEPGQLVTIQSLAETFGVSHMPVREALKRLLAAKALTVVSGRSIGIPQPESQRARGSSQGASRNRVACGRLGMPQHQSP